MNDTPPDFGQILARVTAENINDGDGYMGEEWFATHPDNPANRKETPDVDTA